MASGIIKYESDKSNFGESVTISLNTTYTCPSDGYVLVVGPYTHLSGNEDYTRCQLNGAFYITVGFQISGVSMATSVFVKKNMTIQTTHLPPDSTNVGGSVSFWPLI